MECRDDFDDTHFTSSWLSGGLFGTSHLLIEEEVGGSGSSGSGWQVGMAQKGSEEEWGGDEMWDVMDG